MKSPFPGMDPYLEAFWPDVHTRMMVYISDEIQRQLPDGLLARVEQSVNVDAAGGEDDAAEEYRPRRRPTLLRPDVHVAAEGQPSWSGGSGGGALAVAEPETETMAPLFLLVPDVARWRRVEIIDAGSGGRVVTAIEVLSPSNKTGSGREAYVQRQKLYVSAGVNLVEIDLLRGGEHTVSAPLASIPVEERRTYFICVFRAERAAGRSVYPISLRDPLPTFAVPLRPTDRDVVLPLQRVLDQCYERGRYDRMDYGRHLIPPWDAEDAAWVAERITARAVETKP